MKTRHDNNMIDHIDVIYVKNEIELLWPIDLGKVCEKTTQDNNVTDHTSAVYIENETKFSWSIGSGANYGENQIRQLGD